MTATWYPLGYNIRPRRLQTIAREAVAKYGGRLPDDEETLLSFKGIGAYTAGAIRSFAFRERAAILDTNVARVLFRVFVGKGDPKSHAMKRHLWMLSETLVPARDVFDFNQALMDFGAMMCVGAKPQVPRLPDGEGVCARRYPVVAGSLAPRRDAVLMTTIIVTAAVVERDGRFLVTRRQAGVHLEGLLGISRRQMRRGRTLEACMARELREELTWRRRRRRDAVDDTRVSRATRRASLLTMRHPRRAARRSWDKRCDG